LAGAPVLETNEVHVSTSTPSGRAATSEFGEKQSVGGSSHRARHSSRTSTVAKRIIARASSSVLPVWHETLRSRADVALIVMGVVVFVVGGVVLARPFVTRRSTLFITVPVAAAVGIAVLGIIALVCAAVIALVESPGDTDWHDLINSLSPWSTGSPRKRGK
jgi:hypothetical protein